jgi:hypothetical protein
MSQPGEYIIVNGTKWPLLPPPIIRFSQLFPNEDVNEVIRVLREIRQARLLRQSQPDYQPGE